jgi:hypothetical protein
VKKAAIIFATTVMMLLAAAILHAAETPEPEAYCTATATCVSGSVSCSGYYSCVGVDEDCPSSNGWVECDGQDIYCGGCPCPKENRPCNTDEECRDSSYPLCTACHCEMMFASPDASDDTDAVEFPRGYCKCY